MTTMIATLAEAQRVVDDALGDGYRVEVVGETIVVTPGAGWSHNATVGDLLVWLRPRAPQGLAVVSEVDVSADATGERREPYWRPDLVVSPGPAEPAREWLLAGEVVVAVEVVSPSNREGGTGARYLHGKAEHGAAHGIGWLLGVDGDAVSWWRNGQRTVEGPQWAAGLRVEGSHIALDG